MFGHDKLAQQDGNNFSNMLWLGVDNSLLLCKNEIGRVMRQRREEKNLPRYYTGTMS